MDKKYKEFLESKKKTFIESGFEIDENILNSNLFDFQKYAVKIALLKGKFALFFDCGLGKTLMQLSWAESIFNHTKKKVLILAPLAVVEQTKDEALKFGIPDYILFFRNDGDNLIPITHQDKDPSKPDYLPVDLWQKYASPVWYDIDYSRTLQYRSGRDGNDEKHIAPLQLDTIERILHLYSNEGETVLSPFGGIGSEGFCALKMGRKSISIELKESYFAINSKNHKDCIEEKNAVLTLF